MLNGRQFMALGCEQHNTSMNKEGMSMLVRLTRNESLISKLKPGLKLLNGSFACHDGPGKRKMLLSLLNGLY